MTDGPPDAGYVVAPTTWSGALRCANDMVQQGRAAVLFDMDGLLIDSEPLWLQAETAVMARLGSDWTEADQRALLGGSLDRTVRYLLAKAARPAPPGLVGQWLMSDIAERVHRDGMPLQPGAADLLAAVARAGLPSALVTSSERSFAGAVLASTGLRFDAVVCADDVTATKPDPEPYLLAAKLVGVPPQDCFALEDSPNGVASAQAAGCRVIAVPSLVPIPPAPGRTVVGSLLDLEAGPGGVSVALAANPGVGPSNPGVGPSNPGVGPSNPGVSPSDGTAFPALDCKHQARGGATCPPTTRSPGCRCAGD